MCLLSGVHRYDLPRRRLAVAFATLAGFVDAVGFVAAGGYFVSFMSGNTTRLGVDLASNLASALVPIGLIASFVAGVFLGALGAERYPERRKTVSVGITASLLLAANIFQAGGSGQWFLAACAMAMGALNNAFSREGEVQIGVTYLTGALVRFAQGLALRVRGQDPGRHAGYGALWLGLALGSLAGAATFAVNGTLGLQLAAAAAVVLLIVTRRIEKQRTLIRD